MNTNILSGFILVGLVFLGIPLVYESWTSTSPTNKVVDVIAGEGEIRTFRVGDIVPVAWACWNEEAALSVVGAAVLGADDVDAMFKKELVQRYCGPLPFMADMRLVEKILTYTDWERDKMALWRMELDVADPEASFWLWASDEKVMHPTNGYSPDWSHPKGQEV